MQKAVFVFLVQFFKAFVRSSLFVELGVCVTLIVCLMASIVFLVARHVVEWQIR